MKYRRTLNRGWAAVSLLWIAWCLYWPFYARKQDRRAFEADAAATYRVCLAQPGMTEAQCAQDRTAYAKFGEQLVWPSEENAYRAFAGKRWPDALAFLTVLCLLPVVAGYAALRLPLELFLLFKYSKQRVIQ